jgi:hypothetical protein
MSNKTATSAPTVAPNTITLESPLKRGEQTISTITVRKPGAGELRGLKLTDLLQMDVAALQTLLPRVTQPALTTADVAALDLVDLLELGSEVVGFFMSRADRTSSPSA